jgi:thioesterase domain-containing protein/acyl carrier protein
VSGGANGVLGWSSDRRALVRALLAERPPGSGPVTTPAPGRPSAITPRDAIESKLAAIWEEVLAVRPVGIRDNFFDLGGHSLLAVRLFADVWRTFGRELPLTTILQAPTVEALASLLREPREIPSALVPIQPAGASLPLFCVHQHSGQIFCYQALAERLGTEQPVFGLRPEPTDLRARPDRIEDIAARYVEAIRELQPGGPYHVAGYCFGGILAYEIACQLHAAGQPVALLALVESERPDAARGLLARARRAARRVVVELDTIAHTPREHRTGFVLERAAYAAGRAQQRLASPPAPRTEPASGDSPAERELRAIAAMHEAAIARYVPRPYPGRVTLLVPGRRHGGRHHGTSDLGWAALALGGLSVHEIACEGATLVNEPDVAGLADALHGCLHTARR